MTRRTYDALLGEAHGWLRRGCSVALDGSFAKAAQRAQALGLAAALDVAALVVECRCPDDVIRARLEARLAGGATISDGRWELLAAQRAASDPVVELAARQYLVVDTTAPLAACADQARARLAALAGERVRQPVAPA
jgi:predicted kinase